MFRDHGGGLALAAARVRGTQAAPHGDSVIAFLQRSLEAVKTARGQLKPGDLQRKVRVMNKDATVDGMYLRIIVHDNEHMGQLIAYARMNGIVPPWSKAGPD
jgi:uncharacterized damage-inducible protein DinB